MAERPPTPTGLGVGPSQGAPIDPTANVIALVEANAQSAEQLRGADAKFYDAQIAHLKEIGALRAEHAEVLRQSDLAAIDKTRQVDVLAAQASAATAERNAETLRTQLNTTASTMAKQTSDLAGTLSAQTDSQFKDVNSRIAELQKTAYVGSGRQGVVDPQIADLTKLVEAMARNQATGAGKSEGISASWAVAVGLVGVVGTVIGIIGAIAAVVSMVGP